MVISQVGGFYRVTVQKDHFVPESVVKGLLPADNSQHNVRVPYCQEFCKRKRRITRAWINCPVARLVTQVVSYAPY